MSKENQHHHGSDHKHAGGHNHSGRKSGIHKDWRFQLVVILMLVAMAVYVLTNDESIVPGNAPQQEMPAASGL